MVVRGPCDRLCCGFWLRARVRSLVKDLNVENMSSDSCSSLVTKGREKFITFTKN